MANNLSGRADEPTMATTGLRVLAKDDGTWLELETTGGEHALIRMESIADDLGRAGGPRRGEAETIKRWCHDQQHARRSGVIAGAQERSANPPVDPRHERLSEHPAADETGDNVEAMSQDSFPTSDPPSFGGVTRTGGPERAADKKKRKGKG